MKKKKYRVRCLRQHTLYIYIIGILFFIHQRQQIPGIGLCIDIGELY